MIRKCTRKDCNKAMFMHGECYHHYFIAWGK